MKQIAATKVATKAANMILLLLIVSYSLASASFNHSNFDLTSNFLQDLESCLVDDDPFSMIDAGQDTAAYSQSDYLIQTGL